MTFLRVVGCGEGVVYLTLVLLNQDIPAVTNSVDPDQLASEEANIWICTVCHSVCELAKECAQYWLIA